MGGCSPKNIFVLGAIHILSTSRAHLFHSVRTSERRDAGGEADVKERLWRERAVIGGPLTDSRCN